MIDASLVSIVLPTYNGSRYLNQAVESCLNQTYHDLELIIVDDASTDGTPHIITGYADRDKRVHSVRHEANRKLPAALNTGFTLAEGEYLTWTSDDNLYRPNAISEMVEFLGSHPLVDIVYCDYSIIDDTGQTVLTRSVGCPEDLAVENPYGACFMYRRIVQEALVNYSEDLFCAEDYDFWMRASNLFRSQALHRDLYLYRQHNSSLTSVRSRRVAWATEMAAKRNLPRMSWLGNRQRSRGYLRQIQRAKSRKDERDVQRYFWRAVLASPPAALDPIARHIAVRALLGSRVAAFLHTIRSKLTIDRHTRVVSPPEKR